MFCLSFLDIGEFVIPLLNKAHLVTIEHLHDLIVPLNARLQHVLIAFDNGLKLHECS